MTLMKKSYTSILEKKTQTILALEYSRDALYQETEYWVGATFWTIRTGTIPASRFFFRLKPV